MYIYMYNYMPCDCISWKKLGCRTNLVLTQSQRNRMDSDTKNHVLKPMKKTCRIRKKPALGNQWLWMALGCLNFQKHPYM